MSQVKDNALIIVPLFTLVLPLLFFSTVYVLPLINMLDLNTAPTVNDTITQSVDEDWQNGTIENLEVDGSIIYPAASSTGSWTSQLYDVPRNRVLEVGYGADMRDGNGTITVRAWDNDTSGGADQTEVIELSSGENSQQLNFSEYRYFEVELELTESGGSTNQRPNVDFINLEFEVLNSDEIGLSSEQVTSILYLVFVFSLLLMAFTMYYAVSWLLED